MPSRHELRDPEARSQLVAKLEALNQTVQNFDFSLLIKNSTFFNASPKPKLSERGPTRSPSKHEKAPTLTLEALEEHLERQKTPSTSPLKHFSPQRSPKKQTTHTHGPYSPIGPS